jgi:hypothetical protein
LKGPIGDSGDSTIIQFSAAQDVNCAGNSCKAKGNSALATSEDGSSRWMGFAKPRRNAKPGDPVKVVIGQLHAGVLVVQ